MADNKSSGFESIPMPTPVAGSSLLATKDAAGKDIYIPSIKQDGAMMSPDEALKAYQQTGTSVEAGTAPSNTSGIKEFLAELPKTSFDEKVAAIRQDITDVAQAKSIELANQKERAKQPVTRNTFEAAYQAAATAPSYDEFIKTDTPLSKEEMNKIYHQVSMSKADGNAAGRDATLFSDSTLNSSTTATIANQVLGGVGRVGDIVGNLLNIGSTAREALINAGITDSEFKTLKAVKGKEDVYQDSVDALRSEKDPAKQDILRKRVEDNSPDKYTDAEKALFKPKVIDMPQPGGTTLKQTLDPVVKRARTIAQLNDTKNAINTYTGAITSLVNQSDVTTMMESAWADYQRVSPQLGTGTGNTAEAIVDLAMEAGKTIIENPAALSQLVLQSVPDVVAASTSMPAALAANFTEKQQEAQQIYKQTHGEDATGSALNKLNAGAGAAALVDTFGDVLVGHGGIDVAKLASKAGLTTAVKSIDTAAKVATKVSQATVTGAAGEFIAEGGGSALTQLAGTQDTSKVDLASAYAEGVLGAGAGGTVANVTKALDSAGNVAVDVAAKMQGRSDAKEQGSIKELVSNIATMDVAGATAVMKHITASADTTDQQKAEAIRDLESAFDKKAFIEVWVGQQEVKQADEGYDEKRAASIDKGKRILGEMDRASESLKIAKDSFRGQSVEAAYKALTETDQVTPEASRQAANTISDEVNTPYSNISTDMAKDILEKRADILTPEQTANLRSYVTTNEAMDNLSDSMDEAKVRSNIITGGNGNIGARTYVNAIISSLKIGDTEGAISLASDLNKFADRHTAKAEAMQQIVDSFDSGTPMAAAEQIKLMEPFNSKVKGNQFKPFVNSVPKYARMIGEEAKMLNIVSTEMNNRVQPPATQPSAAAQASSTTTPEVSQAGVSTAPAVDTTQQANGLQQLLSLPEDQAIAQLNPGNKTISEDDRVILQPGDVDVPVGAKPVAQVADKANAPVSVVEDATGTMYAVSNDQVVGMIGPGQGDETVLDMVQGSEGKGIATALTAEYIRKNPEAKAGGFTKGGEATYRAALRQLRNEPANRAPASRGDAAPVSGTETQAAMPEGITPKQETTGAVQSTADKVLSAGVMPEMPAADYAVIKDLIDEENNLISRFIKIKDVKATGNPLITDPEFVNKLRSGVSYETLKPYLPDSVKSISADQVNLLNQFLAFNEAFVKSVDEVIGDSDINYAYTDAINYLRGTDGKIKPAVIDAMSVSAFNWLVVNANESLIKDADQLGSILNITNKGHVFSNYTYNTLGKSGLPYNEHALSVGNEIINTLGFGLNSADAPHTLSARLATSLGARTLQTLAQVTMNGEPFVKFINVTAAQREIANLIETNHLSEIEATKLVNSKGHEKIYTDPLRTVQVNYTEDANGFRKPIAIVQGLILDPAKAAGSFLQTLFSTLDPVQIPTFEPVTKVSQTMKRTDRKLTDFAKDQLRKFNETKTYLKPEMVKIFGYFNADEIAEMFGFETDLETKVHQDSLESAKSKNNLIRTNVDKAFNFINAYENRDQFKDYTDPFYLSMEVNRVNRAQVTQRVMNMQSDKIARHMAYQENWKTDISLDDGKNVDAFMLGVAQALGVSVDKSFNTNALQQLKVILNKDHMVKAIESAVALINDSATPEQMLDIKAAVVQQGKTAAALDGIIAYAGYVDAINNDKPSFTSTIGIEYDGVTNGPMLALVQFATANSDWANDLKAGGIYINSPLDNVVEAKRQGISDRYEKVTYMMDRLLKSSDSIPSSKKENAYSFKLTPQFKSALNTIFGLLTEINPETGDLKVTPVGRDIAKYVVTPKTYQASDAKTQAKLGDEALATIRQSLADMNTAANESELPQDKRMKIISDAKALFTALNELAPQLVTVPVINGKKDYLKATIGENNTYNYASIEGPKITMTFTEMLAATYGAMFTNAVNLVNKSMEDSTKDTVQVTNMAVMLYEVARTKLIDDAAAAKAAAGIERSALSNELTVAEIKAIDAQLQFMFPEVDTALSSQQGTGVSLVESNNTGTATKFRTEMKLTDKTIGAFTTDGKKLPAAKSSNIITESEQIESPGVRGVVNMNLATDGAIATRGYANSKPQLSLFDAHMSGVSDAVNNSKEWNRAMFKTMLNHSIPVNTAKMVNNVLTGFNSIVGNFEFTPDMLRKYSLYDYLDSGLSNEMLAAVFKRYSENAHRMQETKRAALTNNTVTINHYFAEGASVTYVNGTEVDYSKLTPEELTNAFVSSTITATDSIRKAGRNADDVSVDTAASTIQDPVHNVRASADNDLQITPELSEVFDVSDDILTAQEALSLLSDLSNSATVNAVNAIVNALLPKLESDLVIVRYDSRKQYKGELAWLNTNQDIIQYASNSRGMYMNASITGGAPTIVLMAETMPYSGVTKETLTHEVIHHLFDQKVFNNTDSAVAAELQNLVRAIKLKLPEIINSDPETAKFIASYGGMSRFPALTTMREFVAWGLSSSQFQKILEQVPYTSVNDLDNKLNIKPRSALAKLRDLVQKVIFNRDIKASTNMAIDNALNALLTVALKTQESRLNNTIDSVSRQQGPMSQLHAVTKMNSKKLFDTLKDLGDVKAPAEHQVFLGNMLSTVVNVVLNPLQVDVISSNIGESAGVLSAHDKLDIYVADNAGLNLTTEPAQYGFNKSAQEIYVHGLYQAILEEGLKTSNVHLNAANDFFNRAKASMTYKDFMVDPTNQDSVAIREAQNRYDSVFNVSTAKVQMITDTSSGLTHAQEKSDYLRNFLALAATNESFRNALDKIKVPTQAQPVGLFARILELISSIIDMVSDRVTGVDSSLSTTANIDKLTKRLVAAELRSKSQAEKILNNSIEYSSIAVGGAVSLFKKGLYKLGTLPPFRNNPIQAVRVASTIARIVGNNKTQFFFQVADELFARLNQGKQTLIGEIASEIKGTTKENAKVHSLSRIANFILDRGRKSVIEAMSNTTLKQFKRDLTAQERTAITKQLLRTDAVSLLGHGYDINDLANLLDSAGYLNQEIDKFEHEIRAAVPTHLATFYLNQAEDLGFTMVNGYSSNVGTIPNAYGIARLWGTGETAPADSTLAVVEPLIDALATLRAIERTTNKGAYNTAVVNLIRSEYARTDGDAGPHNNGITFALAQHQVLKDKALKDNFSNSPALMRKGYMPDINNRYIDVTVASTADRAHMKQMGYREVHELEKDSTDPTPGKVALFLGDGAGMAQYMRGALSTTHEKTKGNRVRDYNSVVVMHAQKHNDIQSLFTQRKSPSYGRNNAYMQPVYNELGQVVDYRYVMAESSKDDLLSRDDDFSKVLGKLAGNVYDKTVTKPHNETVIDALKEQYDLDVKNNRVDDYIRVSNRSDDVELKDLYNLLPHATKQYIKQVFGSESIPIRAEFLRVIFGYRKISIADIWKDGGVDNNTFQVAVKAIFDSMFHGSGLQKASQFERTLQDIVRVAKSNIVVRMGSTTMMNLLSNTYDLMIRDVTMKDAIANQVTGYKKGIEYVKHASRIAELDLLLEANHTPVQRQAMEAERAQLKHLQAINPVSELIEAGLLQTIVLDINQDIDPFSYSSILATKVDEQINRLPAEAKDAAKFIFMTRDSKSFEFMNRIVQFSDFAARYALYKQLTERAVNPMSKAEAIQDVITQFVNYDLPTHRLLQYGNDMGVIWFSRYWLRIQKVIAKKFAEHPAKVLMGLSAQGVLGVDLPDNGDSSILHTGLMHPLRGIGGIGSGLMANPIIPN